MITIEQLLESVDLDFEPRWVTKDEGGWLAIWEEKPHCCSSSGMWQNDESCFLNCGYIKLAEFAHKDWTECIYEVPRKTTEKIEKIEVGYNNSLKARDWQDIAHTVANKINELVDYTNALIESNNIHEKQIDELQMKLEPEKCAVNELKGAKNE